MRRTRRIAIVLMAVGLVTSAIYATGAFSTLTTQRNAEVAVTGDASGYLGLRPAPGPNGKYAQQGKDGQLRLRVGEAVTTGDASAEGLNPDAVTTVENVFTITNQGVQPVGLWLSDGNDAVTFQVNSRSIENTENAISLNPGDTASVGVEIDTRNADVNQDLLNSVTFKANTDVTGRKLPGQGGGAGESPPADTGGDNQQTDSSNPTPTPTPKTKEDSGGVGAAFNNYVVEPTNEHIVEPTANAINGVITAGGELLRVTGEFLTDLVDLGRQELLEKFAYVTNQPLDALKSLSETAWNTLVGFFLGEIGMPGGSFKAQESNSVFYLGGSMLSVFNPITDSVAGIRDLAAHIVKGQALYAAIEALGLIPGGSVVQDLTDLKKITETWVKNFPQKAAKKFQPLSDMILKHLPTSAQRKIGGYFPDAAKRSDDASAGARKGSDTFFNNKIDEDVVRDLKKNHGYSDDRMRRLVNNKEFRAEDFKTLAKENVDFRFVEGLSKNGVSPENIKILSKAGANLELARRLSGRGFSGDGLAYIAKYGDKTNPKLTLKRAEELKNIGYKTEDIVTISRHADSSYLIRPQWPLAEKFKGPLHAHKAQNPAGAGVTTNQLRKLREQDIPSGHVSHYVNNGYSLKLVHYLSKHGHASDRIRNFLVGSPEKVKKRVKRVRQFRDGGSQWGSMIKDTYGWCNMEQKKGEIKIPCGYLPYQNQSRS